MNEGQAMPSTPPSDGDGSDEKGSIEQLPEAIEAAEPTAEIIQLWPNVNPPPIPPIEAEQLPTKVARRRHKRSWEPDEVPYLGDVLKTIRRMARTQVSEETMYNYLESALISYLDEERSEIASSIMDMDLGLDQKDVAVGAAKGWRAAAQAATALFRRKAAKLCRDRWQGEDWNSEPDENET